MTDSTNKKINLLTFNTINICQNTQLKTKDLVFLQTPECAKNNLFLLVEVNNLLPNSIIEGVILGTEGFNRGSEKNVFRKIYTSDYANLDLNELKSGSKIMFHCKNIMKILS
jgi:hypothetical protein